MPTPIRKVSLGPSGIRMERDAGGTVRLRSTTPEVWERMGVSAEAVVPYLFQAAAQHNTSRFGPFQRYFFSKLVPNVRKLGLLDANGGYLRQQWAEHGLMEFEFADDTASDYETYDAVAADRAAEAHS